MSALEGTDLIGQVVIYRGSKTDYHGVSCIVVAYDENWGRYTIDPVTAFGARSTRITRVHRMSFYCTGKKFPVCTCGHAVTHQLPRPVCGRCDCPDHKDAQQVPSGGLSDTQLWARVKTGTEQVIRDADGKPVAVVVPFADYLAARAITVFDHA